MPSTGSYSARVRNSIAIPSLARNRPETEDPWRHIPRSSQREHRAASSPKKSCTDDFKDFDHGKNLDHEEKTLGLNSSKYDDIDSSITSAQSSSPNSFHERNSGNWSSLLLLLVLVRVFTLVITQIASTKLSRHIFLLTPPLHRLFSPPLLATNLFRFLQA
jgi:hypothetical protein